MPLGMDVGLGPGHNVLDGISAPPKRGTAATPPLFGGWLLWPNGRPCQQLLSSCWKAYANTFLTSFSEMKRLCMHTIFENCSQFMLINAVHIKYITHTLNEMP